MHLIYLGPLPSSCSDADRINISEAISGFCKQTGSLVYFESLSQLSDSTNLNEFRLFSLKSLFKIEKQLVRVIRIGGVPTHRIWRNLSEPALSHVEITNIDTKKFSGLPSDRPKVKTLQLGDWKELKSVLGSLEAAYLKNPDLTRVKEFKKQDHNLLAEYRKLIQEFEKSEIAFFRELKKQCQHGDWVYLGNSLPVREWDAVQGLDEFKKIKFEANRGANGIDGQLSSFLGWTSQSQDGVHSTAWAILGDLTTLYNLDGPWILRDLPPRRRVLVIVNNGGGKIFSGLKNLNNVDPQTRARFFELQHHVNFGKWAEFWGVDYEKITDPNEIKNWNQKKRADQSFQVLEIQPDTNQSILFSENWALK